MIRYALHFKILQIKMMHDLKMAMIYKVSIPTFLLIFRIGSIMLRASTVPQVTLGNKGVNAK